MPDEVRPGREYVWERLITAEDIRRFAELSGDKGRHHLENDAQGRLLAHGLLTASLPTKLGGDLDYIAQLMHFHFIAPVYAGDRLRCVGRVQSVKKTPLRLKLSLAFTVVNQAGTTVLEGSSSGYISAA